MTIKKIKKIAAFAFALVAGITYLISNEKKEDITVSSVQNRVEIVLLDKDKDCVPFSIRVDSLSLEEQLKEMFSLMKNTQKKIADFSGFFSDNSELISAFIENDVLMLNFNKEFLDLDPMLENKALEAISYVFTQFEDVRRFDISVEGAPFKRFSNGSITLSMPMDDSFALNNFDTFNSLLHKTEGFSLAILKSMNNYQYYTLKTIRSSRSMIESITQFYTNKSSVLFSNQNQYKRFELFEENEKLILNISEEILNENKQCDEEKLKPILLTLKSNFDAKVIQVRVEGIKMLEIDVKDIIFNEI